jgi:hypothetical protein
VIEVGTDVGTDVGTNVGTIANFAEREVVPYGRTLNLLRTWLVLL